MRFGAIGIATGVILLVGLILAFSCAYTVDAGERAVVLRSGAIIGTSGPGLHFKNPLFDSVEEISTRTYTVPYEKEPFYSKDQQSATADVSITFAVVPDAVDDVYAQFGTVEAMLQRIVTPRVKREFKEVMGQFNASTAIQERERMGVEVSKAISAPSPYFVIESVQVENIDFSDAYEDAIEARMLAEVGIATATQQVEAERKRAEQAVVKAQGEADSKLAYLKAEANGIREIGDAQAGAIRSRGAALRDNPLLIELTKAERWNGITPTHVIPNGTVPFLDAAK
jgi:regulator of protease activity HflC (stomatin/prohibitin superfamily)